MYIRNIWIDIEKLAFELENNLQICTRRRKLKKLSN